MPVTADVDWVKVQNERTDGASVGELAKKYDVSYATIYNHTKAASNGNGHKAASPIGQVLTVKKPRRFVMPSRQAGKSAAVAQMISDLEAKKAKIDEAIGALRAIEE